MPYRVPESSNTIATAMSTTGMLGDNEVLLCYRAEQPEHPLCQLLDFHVSKACSENRVSNSQEVEDFKPDLT